MLTLQKSPRHHYRDPRDKARIVRRLIITVVILAIIGIVGWLGYKWYQALNNQPPMSVQYIHHKEKEKKSPQLYQQISLKLGTATSPLAYGQTGTIAATTAAGAKCTVTIYFRNGDKATGPDIKPKTAGDDGAVSWTWTVKKSYPYGIWPYIVECRNPTGDEKKDAKITISDPTLNR